MRNENVAKRYPKTFSNINGDEVVILNELCECGRLITEHADTIQPGHGPSLDGECPKFTWVKWITKEGDDE